MNDPRVEALDYSLVSDKSDDFSNARELVIDDDNFVGTLSRNALTLRPKAHYATVREARQVADRFVRAWEIAVGLDQRRPIFRFEFIGSRVIDQSPSPGHIEIEVSDATRLGEDQVICEQVHSNYPPAPAAFSVSPNVETLWQRFCFYRAGKEPLLTMAYFSLSVVQMIGGGRRNAAASLNIEKTVLDKLGELSSLRGDGTTARKVDHRTKQLSGAESQWVEAAVPAIVRHLGGSRERRLSMSDLPPL